MKLYVTKELMKIYTWLKDLPIAHRSFVIQLCEVFELFLWVLVGLNSTFPSIFALFSAPLITISIALASKLLIVSLWIRRG